ERRALVGDAKYHARICLTDNLVWLSRVPQMCGDVPQSLIDYLIRSESATLKFLETIIIPSPWLLDYGIASDETMNYVLTEEMTSKPWDDQGPREKRIVYDQDKESMGWLDILIEINPFRPLNTATDDYISFAEQNMALIPDKQHFTVFMHEVPDPDAGFLSGEPNSGAVGTTEQFYLKHLDAQGKYLMVDGDLNIIGNIDW
ncbi:uncharacterized protein N7484_008070, partial [Penicillium longicatenatum]|uniref:uncharacterized protein n=1 Tax=Penicillium longicatenatum TaxID=1561947 RepID=UPI0025485F2B